MRGDGSPGHGATASSSPGALERRVRELQTALAEREAELGALHSGGLLNAELLATVSHELRSPLAMVKGYAATLRKHDKRLSQEERIEFLDNITEACDRLDTVIARLFELSRLETGALTLQCSVVDIAALARESVAATSARLSPDKVSRLSFDVRVEGDPSASRDSTSALDVWGDPWRLREVLDALLDNACKYSPQGGTVEVLIRPADEAAVRVLDVHTPRAMLEVRVRDTGMGIPADHLGRIFERFHRVDTRLTREVQGLGVGLALCKDIVELHGGAIWADSTPGEGSTFHVVLPRADDDWEVQ
jgi:signal transduction histidine kinase